MDINELDHRFAYHAPTPATVPLHEEARDRMKDQARWLDFVLPDCREKSLAITALEEAMMWTNAGIARVLSNPLDGLPHIHGFPLDPTDSGG